MGKDKTEDSHGQTYSHTEAGMRRNDGGHEDYPQHGAGDASVSSTSSDGSEGSGDSSCTQAERLASIDGQSLKWTILLNRRPRGQD